MALTRDFKETIRARAARDQKFRKELLREGIESLLTGDIGTARRSGLPNSRRPRTSHPKA